MRAILLLGAVLLAGCPDEPYDPMKTPDAGMTGPVDTGVKMTVFEAEELTGARLVFGEATLSQAGLQVDLVAHAMSDVYGLAFRIEYDPAVLEFETLERSDGFTHQQVFEVKLARPGLVVVAASAMGEAQGIALDGAAVARLSLKRLTPALTELRIVRPFGLDAAGEELRYAAGKGALIER